MANFRSGSRRFFLDVVLFCSFICMALIAVRPLLAFQEVRSDAGEEVRAHLEERVRFPASIDIVVFEARGGDRYFAVIDVASYGTRQIECNVEIDRNRSWSRGSYWVHIEKCNFGKDWFKTWEEVGEF